MDYKEGLGGQRWNQARYKKHNSTMKNIQIKRPSALHWRVSNIKLDLKKGYTSEKQNFRCSSAFPGSNPGSATEGKIKSHLSCMNELYGKAKQRKELGLSLTLKTVRKTITPHILFTIVLITTADLQQQSSLCRTKTVVPGQKKNQ